jgi:biopolymer transport protein ExbD
MITRPLDLASKLRPPPASFDWLFFVNGGAIVLFFVLFGSRFVLAPGVGVDFRLARVAGANAEAKNHTHVIRVMNSGQILTDRGPHTLAELRLWLKDEASRFKQPSILLIASGDVPLTMVAQITSLAGEAGFSLMIAAEEPLGSARAEAR